MGKKASKSSAASFGLEPQGSGLNLVRMEEGGDLVETGKDNISKGAEEDKRRVPPDTGNMALLVLLYAMQGVPLGLSMGSIPFILKANASYAEIGLFSLAGYPYALKLLWSPLVDTLYLPSVGCRKSWVLPIQMVSGLLMIISAPAAQHWLDTTNVRAITSLFFVFVLLAATQDIAVDGWALTLLSRQNIGHASTCQTVGINSGYFASFTIFLALNDAAFCNRYLRTQPREQGLVSLAGYFTFWGAAYILVTILLAFKREKPVDAASPPPSPRAPPPAEEDVTLMSPSSARSTTRQLARRVTSFDQRKATNGEVTAGSSQEGDALLGSSDRAAGGQHAEKDEKRGSSGEGSRKALHRGRAGRSLGLGRMYRRLWKVAMLKDIRSLTMVLLFCKLGSITAEAAGVFKLMEKGVSRETISLIVLVEFPLELLFALCAGRWASQGRPFTPWLAGYFLRLATAALTTLIVALFPLGGTLRSAPLAYAAIVATGILTSFASTIMFVAQGTFFARISDSSMGGTYLTLLNTISNLGSAWPKFFVFTLMDWLTIQHCVGADVEQSALSAPPLCPAKDAAGVANPCVASGGTCVDWVDGFYPLSSFLVVAGLVIGLTYRKQLQELERAKEGAWRA